MTPFEAEPLAISAAALWVAVGALVAQVVVGAGQIAVVWHRIRTMIASGQARAREYDQRPEEAVRNHEQTMTSLRALIARAEPQPGSSNN